MPVQPTPYPEVNTLLERLLHDVQALLGERFAGMYLHGSLASGDFTPGRSDIDFVVATHGELPGEMIPALRDMHARLTSSGLPWADVLEGSYIPLAALRRHDPANCSFPALRVEGSFEVDGHGADWIIQRHVLREKGITLAGPPPAALIDPVSPADLRQSARGILIEWWLPQLTDHSRLQSDEYQAYAILTMCRIRYTIENGDVVSKKAAARWAQAKLGAPWAGLIAEALAWRHGQRLGRLDETLELMRLTLLVAGPPTSAPGAPLPNR